MSSSQTYNVRDCQVVLTCECVPRHICLRNKSTQTNDNYISYSILRSVDLVPIPKPEFVLYKSVCDFSQQVSEGDFEVSKHQVVLKEACVSALDLPSGLEIKSERELQEEEFERVVLEHIVEPKVTTRRRATKKFQWPAELED